MYIEELKEGDGDGVVVTVSNTRGHLPAGPGYNSGGYASAAAAAAPELYLDDVVAGTSPGIGARAANTSYI